jgi:hypothetical protein
VKLVIIVEDVPVNVHRVHESTFVQISPDHSRMDGSYGDMAVIAGQDVLVQVFCEHDLGYLGVTVGHLGTVKLTENTT